MHISSLIHSLLPTTRRCAAVLGLALGGAALAQTVLPAISTGMSPARGSSITNVVIPPAATAATGAAGGALLATPLPDALGNAMQSNASGGDLGEASNSADGVLNRGKADSKSGKGPLKSSKSAPKLGGPADAQSNASDATQQNSNQAADDAATDETASEAVRRAKADETEFQRFVFGATGVPLRLYGYELFAKASSFAPVQAAPVPAGYVLGVGDEIVVQVNGLFDVSSTFTIDRDGRIMVPKVGPLSLAGVPLSDVERVLAAHIGKVYRNFTVSATLGRLRSIEVFVVGQARKPGKHVVSSLSGVVNALLETGGPSSNGSLRAIELRRGGKTIATVDLYAFLSNGDNSADARLMSGDVIYIPPAGPRAALLGTINAPAIYELRPGETIAQVLALSGGLPTLAAPQKAQLERVDANRDIPRYVEDFALDATGQGLALKGGDILTVFQISPQISNVVTLQGNVASPLRYTFHPGMRVADLLADRRLLIPGSYWSSVNRGAHTGNYSKPEANLDYATIQRLDPQAVRTRIIAFNLGKAIALDKTENLELASGDIVTVYGPNEAGTETQDSVTVVGEIVGGTKRFVWRDGFTIKDVIPSTQWLVDYYSYWQRGSARSLTNDINWDYAQVIRRVPATLQSKAITFNLGRAVLGGLPADNIRLEPGDQIALFTTTQLPVPTEKRAQVVTLAGEVMVPGKYQVEPGETLPELIKRAGGLSKQAYLYGTVFTRESTRQRQEENISKAKQRLQAQTDSQVNALAQNTNTTDPTKAAALQSQAESQKQLLKRVEGLKATGRIALDLDAANPVMPPLALEDGDSVTVPTRSNFVGVFGEVYAESAFLHRPGMTVGDYLDKAGATRDADTDNLVLVRADGTLEGSASRLALWSTGLSSKKLNPGDSLFVPPLVDRRSASSLVIDGAKDWTSLIYQFALGAAAFKTLRN